MSSCVLLREITYLILPILSLSISLAKSKVYWILVMLQKIGFTRLTTAMIGCILVFTLLIGSSMQVVGAESCGGVDTAILDCEAGTKTNGVFSLLLMAINILTAGIGIAAVGGIVYAAIQYTSAADNAEQISQAKTKITSVVVGLVLFVGMYGFLQYIIPGGIFNRDIDIPVAQNPPSDTPSGKNGNGGDDNETNKKATVRIGAYNAWSVSQTNDADQVRRLSIGMAKMRAEGAEIIALQELSTPQTQYIKANSYWGVYRSSMSGDRGLGVAYKKEAFEVIASGDLVIPRSGADQREPILTLERKRDKARITVMSVHLVAFTYGRANYEEYQPKQQKAVKERALDLKKQGRTVILAGDFNWDFSKRKGYMTPFQHKGIRYTNFFAPPDQKISNFKDIDAGAASDHRLIFVDAETTSFGR